MDRYAIVCSLVAAALAASPASSQQAAGEVRAMCTVMGGPAQLHVQYEIYGDYQVWMDRATGQFQDMVGSGLTTTYWQGYIDTAYGRYLLSGENNFLEALPQGGYYSDKVTLEVIATGPNTFMLRDFFSDQQPTYPCQIVG